MTFEAHENEIFPSNSIIPIRLLSICEEIKHSQITKYFSKSLMFLYSIYALAGNAQHL